MGAWERGTWPKIVRGDILATYAAVVTQPACTKTGNKDLWKQQRIASLPQKTMQAWKRTRSYPTHQHNVLLLPLVSFRSLCLQHKGHTEKYLHMQYWIQSDSTFVLEDVLDKLNVDAQPVKLKLSTMTAIDTIISSKNVHGLQVRGLHSKNHIHVQQAYSCDFIPVDKSYIPTKETALLWPHHRHLADKLPPLQDCDVGLLVGYDCPSALAPL